MPGFGLIKRLRSRTLGNKRRLQNEEPEEFMGFGILDALIETRYDLTGTTGMFGARWKKGESVVGKFLNKQPEIWPPPPEEGSVPTGSSNLAQQRELEYQRLRQQYLQQSQAPLAQPQSLQPPIEYEIGFLGV